jgi:hypothetical protein
MASITGKMSNMAEDGADAAREAFSSSREHIGEASDAVRKAARTTAKEAAAYGRENVGRAYGAAADLSRSMSRYVAEKPVQAGLIALGGLLLAGWLLRRRH